MSDSEDVEICNAPRGFVLDAEGSYPKFDAELHLELEEPSRNVLENQTMFTSYLMY